MYDPIEVDERWMDEWVKFGLSELEAYLNKQARFEAYCATRKAAV